MKEKVRDDRTCEESGIPIWYCAAYRLREVDKNLIKGSATEEDLEL
jgi:hypothetical protein